MNQTDPSINFISDSFENTWRNVAFGILLLLTALAGIVYILNSGVYTSVAMTQEESSTMVTRPLPKVTAGMQEYASHIVGGDIVFEHYIEGAPRKREMFNPFDTRQLSAMSAFVKDINTGEMLYGKDMYEVRPIASITKLMTALVLEEYVTDWSMIGVIPRDTIYDSQVVAGERSTLEQWYQLGLVGSSNRAVLALVDATGIGRDRFVARMNEKALELGMVSTIFVEPTGIDAGNVSTASEVAILLTEVLQNEHIAHILGLHGVSHISPDAGQVRTISNTNWVLTRRVAHNFDIPVLGKTGFITQSGYNFTGRFVREQGYPVVVVVLGADAPTTRFSEAILLANWSFANYYWE